MKIKTTAITCLSNPEMREFKIVMTLKKLGEATTAVRMTDKYGWCAHYIVTGRLTHDEIEKAVWFNGPASQQILDPAGCEIFGMKMPGRFSESR